MYVKKPWDLVVLSVYGASRLITASSLALCVCALGGRTPYLLLAAMALLLRGLHGTRTGTSSQPTHRHESCTSTAWYTQIRTLGSAICGGCNQGQTSLPCLDCIQKIGHFIGRPEVLAAFQLSLLHLWPDFV